MNEKEDFINEMKNTDLGNDPGELLNNSRGGQEQATTTNPHGVFWGSIVITDEEFLENKDYFKAQAEMILKRRNQNDKI